MRQGKREREKDTEKGREKLTGTQRLKESARPHEETECSTVLTEYDAQTRLVDVPVALEPQLILHL